jgi:hypothetical protein
VTRSALVGESCGGGSVFCGDSRENSQKHRPESPDSDSGPPRGLVLRGERALSSVDERARTFLSASRSESVATDVNGVHPVTSEAEPAPFSAGLPCLPEEPRDLGSRPSRHDRHDFRQRCGVAAGPATPTRHLSFTIRSPRPGGLHPMTTVQGDEHIAATTEIRD